MKTILKKLLVMLPMLAVGFVCGLLIGKYALEAESRGLPGSVFGVISLLFAGFVLALYLQTAVHEAGMDQCRFPEAQDAMEKLLAQRTGVLGLHRNLLHCDLLYCRLQSGQLASVKQLLTREQLAFMKTMKAFPSVIRTQYALATAEGDQAKAQACRKAFEKAAKTYPYPAEIQSERGLLAMADRTGATI